MASVWAGVVTFGLVSIPVKLYVAARPETVSFNQLHSVCHSRLRQKLYCPTCECDVERGEIVKGYKLDGYVIMDDADFEAAEREASRALEVLEFVDAESVSVRTFSTGPSAGSRSVRPQPAASSNPSNTSADRAADTVAPIAPDIEPPKPESYSFRRSKPANRRPAPISTANAPTRSVS